MRKKVKIFCCISLLVLFIMFTLMVKSVNVSQIGPNNSEIGFAGVNSWFKNLTSFTKFIKITNILGIFPILLACFYCSIGLFQLIKRKSFKKVDKELYLLGGLYLILGIIYILFEIVIINYRPMLVDGKLEASYPSSHTLLAIVICASAIMFNIKKFKHSKLVNILNWFVGIISIVIVLGRTICGIHWLTDILGSLIISTALLMIFQTILESLNSTKSIS